MAPRIGEKTARIKTAAAVTDAQREEEREGDNPAFSVRPRKYIGIVAVTIKVNAEFATSYRTQLFSLLLSLNLSIEILHYIQKNIYFLIIR